MAIKLISWNVAGRSVKLADQAAALGRQDADIVCLQEVRATTLPRWRAALERLGFTAFSDSSEFIGDRRFFCLTASRREHVELPAIPAPHPERVLSLVIETPAGQLELHNAHVPPAQSKGFTKVETCEAIHYALARPSERHRVLCGDFNTPKFETGEGEVITFAENHPEHLAARRSRDAALLSRLIRWDAAERSLLEGLAEWDLADCFRALHGYDRQDVSWVFHTRSRRKSGHRLDHVLASASLRPSFCDYHHGWREAGLSDHSAMEAVFEPV